MNMPTKKARKKTENQKADASRMKMKIFRCVNKKSLREKKSPFLFVILLSVLVQFNDKSCCKKHQCGAAYTIRMQELRDDKRKYCYLLSSELKRRTTKQKLCIVVINIKQRTNQQKQK